MHKIITAILILLTTVTVSACGVGPDKSREDATDTRNVDKTAPAGTAFNNHYPNVENKCDGHGHRIFVATHNSAVGRNIIVLPDPSCPGYTKGEPAVVATP